MSNPLNDGAISRMYEPWSGRELACEALDGVYPTALDAGGRFLIGSTKDGLFRWPLQVEPGHIEIGKPARVSRYSAVDAIQMSSDGTIALSSHNVIGEFRVTRLSHIDGAGQLIRCGRRTSGARMSPDGRWVAIGMWYASCVEVWDARSASRATTLQLSGNTYVEFSPDGTMLATSDGQGLALWRTQDWRLIRRSSIRGIPYCFSPDGRYLVISTDLAILRLLDTATLTEVASLESPEGFSTKAVAFSPDGSLLAHFTNRNGAAYIWDLQDLRKELAIPGLDWDFPPFASATSRPAVGWRITSQH
jgi:WD40 repeat protein